MRAGPTDITIRTTLAPGDLGLITHLHGVLYAREYGLDTTFEPHVARPLAEFVLAGPDAGRIWIAEQEGHMVGSIAIVRDAEPGEAQLRWFLVVPVCRGVGLGARLIDAALGWAGEQRFARVYLWTFNELAAAIRLYRARGFTETERKRHQIWGRERTEVRMDLMLAEKLIDQKSK